MCDNWAAAQLPNLTAGTYRLTSPCVPDYNCLAWAANDQEKWWWPHEDAFWPEGVPLECTVDAFIAAYATLGFGVCDSAMLEEGCEKIAIFAIREIGGSLTPTHAARQLSTGTWTSKLGPCADVEHFMLESVNGPCYGEPVIFMSRSHLSGQGVTEVLRPYK